MKQIILDTSFIITAVKQKIDFFEMIEGKGLQIVIPEQTIKELKGLKAELALHILEKNKFELIKIPGKDADNAIIKFAKENPLAVVATLDERLKKKIRNSKMVIRGRKKIEII
jgi:rRNA-processing protein FCF1